MSIQELIAEEAANRKDIEDVIEEERAKVDAKTQITQDVFLQWRQKNKDDKIKQQEAVEADRKKKGIMTGREIFAQVWNVIGNIFSILQSVTFYFLGQVYPSPLPPPWTTSSLKMVVLGRERCYHQLVWTFICLQS